MRCRLALHRAKVRAADVPLLRAGGCWCRSLQAPETMRRRLRTRCDLHHNRINLERTDHGMEAAAMQNTRGGKVEPRVHFLAEERASCHRRVGLEETCADAANGRACQGGRHLSSAQFRAQPVKRCSRRCSFRPAQPPGARITESVFRTTKRDRCHAPQMRSLARIARTNSHRYSRWVPARLTFDKLRSTADS